MLYYWFHTLYVFLGSKLFWSKIGADATLTRTRRVSILDCESLKYMANSKYLFYMDLIRFELLFRSRLYDTTAKKGMFAVLGSQKIIYKKPLKRWSKFTITLVLEGWDDKWAYHRQTFEQGNQVCAIGFTKIAVWKNKKSQDMNKIIADCGVLKAGNTISSEIKNLFNDDYNILKRESTAI
jgi:acyl-CoA thioesterase FadM